jgi:hypothetical protein
MLALVMAGLAKAAPILGLAVTLLVPTAAGAKPPAKEKDAPEPASKDEAEPAKKDAGVTSRRFMVGLEAVGLQVPALRSMVADIDPRFVGSTATMGGAGLFGRFRAVPLVAVELAVRSGSVRYRDDADDDVVSQDLILADTGVLLYLARGEVGQLALDAGIGGIFNRVKYELADREGTQAFGSGFVRVGVDAEFLVKRVAFVLSLRSYGVFTVRENVRNKGEIMAQASADARRAPAPALQTFVAAAAGVAYRF